ncbi:hypothetical protein Vadar_017990 [Vaccinium darrowii]|uniref:Uncharacterized protein n=1 Tax=Vaccinium darrowii TaxID=229202 RepID=A0ACB7YWG5_9ERIC|nr:hypothetical protein Vadar_017990 [Vaccinium darrowii]
MSRHICPVKDITLASKRYTIEVMVVKKGMPQTTFKNAKPYQRILLQDAKHRFVEHCFQLKISARTPIQARLIDGLTIRTLKFSFTPIADVAAIEDVDAKIGTNLGTRNSSTFIFNPPIPEAAALRAW